MNQLGTIRKNRAETATRQTTVQINCSGLTHHGIKRKTNQDHFLIADLHKNMHVQASSVSSDHADFFGNTMGKLLFVADGVGGANAGEFASQLAIKKMAEHFLESMHWIFCPTAFEIEQFVNDLKAGAMYSHKAVREDGIRNPQHHGMGTTLTVAYVVWPMMYVLHVGDSRCYLLRDNSLQRLTVDQTLAQVLFDRGQISKSEFQASPYHNVLISAIGSENEPDAIVYKTRLKPKDRLLLCTDGVNAHLDDKAIEAIFRDGKNPQQVCQNLVDNANQLGGSDNITTVVAFCG